MKNKQSHIAIAILAAGASSRMGTPKQLLKWGSNTLLTHAIKQALATKVKQVVVVLGSNYSLIQPQISTYPITVLKNEEWEQGIGTSIACVSKYLSNTKITPEAILITLADQPLISSTYLKKIIKSFTPNKNQIIASLYDDGNKGVPVLFDKIYLKELLLLNEDFGANSIISKNKKNTLSLQVNNVLGDVDTLDDYHNLINFKEN